MSVPLYQRDYSWKIEHVKEFWSDLRAAMAAPSPEYFLGTIVLTPGEGERLTVIDGQQRLATVSMLLAAIRDYFAEMGDADRASVLESSFLSWHSLRKAVREPRL